MNAPSFELTVLRYINSFIHLDLRSLEQLFAPDVTLRDWDIQVSGKAEVLKANQAIFAALSRIRVTMTALHVGKTSAVAELEIDLSDLEDRRRQFRVADVFEFDEQGLIRAIRAYKG
ncbi:MAG: nuclear transport factor 2 family protein [Magnetococcales bacterium]|nr:nuclear transport factor 2 family protein [Magnetococcales bacterium]